MNAFNRVLAFVVLLALFLGAVVLLVVSAGLVSPGYVTWLGTWVQDGLWQVPLLSTGWRAVLVGAALVVALGAPVLLWLEAATLARQPPSIVLRSGSAGRLTVAISAIRELLTRTIREIPGTLDVQSSVRDRSSGLRVSCAVVTQLDVNAPEVMRQVENRVRDAMNGFLGRPVEAVSVHVQAHASGTVPRLLR